MEVTIREKNDGPSIQVKKNDEVVAGTGVTPDAQPAAAPEPEAPAEAPVEAPVEAPEEEAPAEEINKVA